MLNDDFWGIPALKATGESLNTQIQNIKTFIINNQNSDGGWGWTVGGSSDADNTAAAVMALVVAEVSTGSQTITDALNYLKSQQQNDGGFTSEGVTNAAADAWVINAIAAAGQSPASNEWRKSGNNPVGHLLSLQDSDGAFKWTSSQRSSNPEWMTAYAVTALLGSPYPVAIYTPPTGDGNGGGGGGGGGGGAAGITPVINSVTEKGRFTEDVTAKSEDRKVELHIPKDTIGKNKAGSFLTSISIKEVEDPPDPPEQSNVIANVYDFGPDGATFDPAISLTVEYRESKIPAGVAEENLVVAYWDKEAKEWIELEGTVDPENNTITVKISHFTNFTILAHTRPASFTVTDLSIDPTEVGIGETVTISAIVTNTGDLTGTDEVILKVNGDEVEVEEVEVIGGDGEKISFRVTTDAAGTYTVDINGLTGSFVVKEKVLSFTAPPPVPPAVIPPTPPSAEAKLPPSPETSPTEPPVTGPLPPPPSAEPANWPLIGGIIAGVAVFGLFVFFVIRRLIYR